MNHSLGPVITRGGFRTENERNRGKILQLAAFHLVVDRKDAQGIHELALILVQPFDLHVKHHGGVQLDAFPPQDFIAELFLFLLLDGDELFAEGGIDHRSQLFQRVQVRDETGADFAFDEAAQFGIAKAEPAALGNPVCLVLETFGPDPVPVGEQVVLQDFRMQFRHAVCRMGSVNRQFRHMDLAVQDDTEGRRNLFSERFHFLAEPGIDLPDDCDNLRADG